LTFVALSLDKTDLDYVNRVEELENDKFKKRKMGEIIMLEVKGIKRFNENNVMVGMKRKVYLYYEKKDVKLSEVLESWLLQEESLRKNVDEMKDNKEKDKEN
jgi:hypothetical protein